MPLRSLQSSTNSHAIPDLLHPQNYKEKELRKRKRNCNDQKLEPGEIEVEVEVEIFGGSLSLIRFGDLRLRLQLRPTLLAAAFDGQHSIRFCGSSETEGLGS